MMKLKRGTIGDLFRSAWVRAAILLVLYGGTALASCWLAFQLRFDFAPATEYQQRFAQDWAWVVGLQLLFLCLFGQFSGLLSYFSIPDLKRLFYATAGNSLALLVLRYNTTILSSFPRGVILSNFVLAFGGLASVRLTFRVVRERFLVPQSRRNGTARRVAILGAGDVGASLVRELGGKRGLGLIPVAFFDDDKTKWRSRIHEIPVIGAPEALLDQRLNLELDEVIIAMPSASPKRMQEVVQILRRTRLRFVTVPSMDQLATGVVKVSQLRDVEIQDLLGRSPVELETETIQRTLTGKVVMVTGAGGSIGSELCRQIASFNPQRLLLLEQSEGQLFQIEQELIEAGYRGVILPLVADVLEMQRMRYIFTRFRPAVVFHAAAHKHVPMMESQPSEAIRNNTMGTAQIAELALETGVDRFVLISTDKAINPTNVMGASKRLAEIFVQALYASQPTKTKFMAVRFGNVLGSSGSVIPIFNKQIAGGGPVKVTHAEVMRYFMTIPEAAGLVLQSAAQGSGGEIFVLDMGKPVKIVDLARQLIELNGLRPEEDIAIEFVGLRPGEKLFEELSYQGENITPTTHPKIMRFVSQAQPLDEVEKWLEQLGNVLYESEPNQIKLLLKQAVPEYQPYLM
jgi:FlaA1/EpsC-like NDP-sugar epimerase